MFFKKKLDLLWFTPSHTLITSDLRKIFIIREITVLTNNVDKCLIKIFFIDICIKIIAVYPY